MPLPPKKAAAGKSVKNVAGHSVARSPAAVSVVLEDLIGYNLRRADVAMHQNFAKLMRPLALKEVEYSILQLAAQSGGLSQRELCESLAVSPPNMVGLLVAMEARSLIGRVRSTRDRRVQLVTATQQGMELLARANQAVLELDDVLASRLSADERRLLRGLLQKIWLPISS